MLILRNFPPKKTHICNKMKLVDLVNGNICIVSIDTTTSTSASTCRRHARQMTVRVNQVIVSLSQRDFLVLIVLTRNSSLMSSLTQ